MCTQSFRIILIITKPTAFSTRTVRSYSALRFLSQRTLLCYARRNPRVRCLQLRAACCPEAEEFVCRRCLLTARSPRRSRFYCWCFCIRLCICQSQWAPSRSAFSLRSGSLSPRTSPTHSSTCHLFLRFIMKAFCLLIEIIRIIKAHIDVLAYSESLLYIHN